VINTGMGMPPVRVGLGVSLLLWRSGPFGPLALLYTPIAMIIAQFIVAMPLAAGLSRAA
jgi:tungstate transport system permease protein